MDAYAKKLKPGEKLCPAHPQRKLKFRCQDEYLCSDCVTDEHLKQEMALALPYLQREYVCSRVNEARAAVNSLMEDLK